MANLTEGALKPIYCKTDFLENKILTLEIIVDAMSMDYPTKEEGAKNVGKTIHKATLLWQNCFINFITFSDGAKSGNKFMKDLDDLYQKLGNMTHKKTPEAIEEVEGIVE